MDDPSSPKAEEAKPALAPKKSAPVPETKEELKEAQASDYYNFRFLP